MTVLLLMPEERVPFRTSISQGEIPDDRLCQAPLRQVRPGRAPGRACKLTLKILSRLCGDLKEHLPLVVALFLVRPWSVLREREARTAGEMFHRLGKVQPFLQFEELESVAADAAAETVEDLLSRVHIERWRLFAVERAEPQPVLARLLERDIPRDQVVDIDAVPHPPYDVFTIHLIV
jgi:hypothetical protein